MMYGGKPVFGVRPDQTSIEAGLLDDFAFRGVGSGVATPWKTVDRPRRRVVLPLFLEGREEIAAIEAFFAQVHGRRGGFWLPTWLGDLRLRADAAVGGQALVVGRTGLAEVLEQFGQFRRLALWDVAGRLELCEIAGIEPAGDAETITLSAPLGAAVDRRATGCCPVIFARFAEDVLDIEYESETVARTRVPFIEIAEEEEEGGEGEDPIYLYQLRRGASAWRYTGWGEPLIRGGAEWAAADITHGEVRYGAEILDHPVSLSFGVDDPLHPMRGNLMSQLAAADVEIFVTSAGGAAPALVFAGKVGEVRFEAQGKILARLQGPLERAGRDLPGILYQRTDNFRVFDGPAPVSAAAFTTQGTIAAIGDRWIEAGAFALAGGGAPNWFALGRVTVGSEVRLCVGQAGGRLFLNANFGAAEVGAAVAAVAGYDRRIATAAAKFGAIDSFVGFPWMPARNPAVEALSVPQPKTGKK